ncbi:hypothetical protein ACOSP7_019490 [Xanthoceras sorbifolium]
MLTKQYWRFIQNPSSLVARVLKGCYFSNGNLVNARSKFSSSFVWKSLVWGRKLLNVGSCWRIGLGNSAFIYKDRWLLQPSIFQAYYWPVLGTSTTVNQLKLSYGAWNERTIQTAFFQKDAETILNIPPSLSGVEDILCWYYDPHGLYTVKSGY